MIHWTAPDEDGLPFEHVITAKEAVARAKATAAKHGYTYDSDTDALEDFMTVNWAWEKDDDA